MKKMTSFLKAATMLCAVLFLCDVVGIAQEVRYNYVPGTDFTKYRTYKWVEVPAGNHPDQILDAQIRQAVDSVLASKGLTKIAGGQNADLFVAYQVAVDQEKQWNAYGARGWRFGGFGTATSSNINIGTLVLDFYDAAAKQQIWRGDATKTLDPSKDPQKNLAKLQKGIAKLLKNYPPPPR